MADYHQISVKEVGDVAVVRFKTHKILDEMHVQRFGEELISLLDVENRKALLLNFEDVEFLSSAALGHLIKLDRRAKKGGAKLVLSNIRTTIYEVFSITGLDKMFDIKTSEKEALAALAG